MVVRVLADQTIPRMTALVEFVSDEGGRQETAEATMLSREKFDPVRVGHCEEVVTLTNAMLFHVERMLYEASDSWRKAWSLGDLPGHRRVGLKDSNFGSCVLLTLTKFLLFSFMELVSSLLVPAVDFGLLLLSSWSFLELSGGLRFGSDALPSWQFRSPDQLHVNVHVQYPIPFAYDVSVE